jgi:hypothetical protein
MRSANYFGYIVFENGIKSHNNAKNLEWCTSSENTIHAFKTGLRRIKKGIESKCSIPVLQYSKEGILIAEFGSMREAKRVTGIDDSHIGLHIKGLTRYSHAGGYIWKKKVQTN